MILPDDQAVGVDKAGPVAIADVPGKADEMSDRPGANLIKQFVGGDDFHQSPILQLQDAAVGQGHSLGEIHHHFSTMLEHQQLAPQAALVMLEDDDIERNTLAVFRRQDGYGTQHEIVPGGPDDQRLPNLADNLSPSGAPGEGQGQPFPVKGDAAVRGCC